MNGFMEVKERRSMGKRNLQNVKILLVLLISCNALYSQNKTIVPTKGAIVFVKKEIITDTVLYKKSMGKIFDKLTLEVKKHALLEKGKVLDTINQRDEQLYPMFDMIKSFALQQIFSKEPKSIIKFHHSYNNDEIEEFISSNGQYVEKKKFINSSDLKDDDLLIITKVEEFKNETKIIKEFKCYKVVMDYFDLEQFPGLNTIVNVMELWVTEDIKSNFHPFITSIDILEKYFPLEAKHSIKDVEGMYTTYDLVDFSLK